MLGISYNKQQFDAANKMIDGTSKHLGRLVGAATAVGAIKLGFDIAKEAAQFEDARRIFEASGHSLEKFRKASHGLLSDKLLVEKFNFGAQFGIREDEFLRFINIADAAAKNLGKSQDYVFNSIITGVARRENRWLDNAGIIVDKDKHNRELADKLGVQVKDLTPEQQRSTLVAEVLRQGALIEKKVAAGGAEAGKGASDFYDQWTASTNNFKLVLGSVFDTLVKEVLGPVAAWFVENEREVRKWGKAASSTIRVVASTVKTLWPLIKVLGKVVAIYGIGLGVRYVGTLLAQAGAMLVNVASIVLLIAQNAFLAVAMLLTGKRVDYMTGATSRLALAQMRAAGPIIALGLAFAFLILILEEVEATFTDKIGIFDQMKGRWDDLSKAMFDNAMNPNQSWIVRFFSLLGALIAQVNNQLDRFFARVSKTAETSIQQTSAGGEVTGVDEAAGLAKAFSPGGLLAAGVEQYTEAITQALAWAINPVVSAVSPSAGKAMSEMRVTVDANGASAADQGLANNIANAVSDRIGGRSKRTARGTLLPSSGTGTP